MNSTRTLGFLLISAGCLFGQNAALLPWTPTQFLSTTGAPLAAGKVCTYQAGTSTPLATYTDSSAGTPNANPVILDSTGSANIWLANNTAYKIIVLTAGTDGTCSTGTTIRTVDNVKVTYPVSALGDPGGNGIVKRTALDVTSVAAGADLPVMVASGGSHSAGAAPDPGAVSGTTHFLREDATWAVPPAYLGDPGTNGVLKRTALNTTADAVGSDLPVMVASGASHSGGAAPDPGSSAGTSRFLREDATWQAPPAGITTQTVGGSRALNTIYQNTTGSALFVSVSVSMGGSLHTCDALSDSSSSPLTIVAIMTGASATTSYATVFFVVLPNNYYDVSCDMSSGILKANWVEWH